MPNQFLFAPVEMDTTMMAKVIYVSLVVFNVKHVKHLKKIAFLAKVIESQVNALVQLELMTME